MQSSVRHHYRLISGTIHRFAQCAPRSASDPIGSDYVELAAFLGESERFHTFCRPSVSLCWVQSRKNVEKPRCGNGARQTQDKWWPKGILKCPLLSTAYPDLISQHGILSIRRRRSRYSSLLACHLFVILINDASPREIRFLDCSLEKKEDGTGWW